MILITFQWETKDRINIITKLSKTGILKDKNQLSNFTFIQQLAHAFIIKKSTFSLRNWFALAQILKISSK